MTQVGLASYQTPPPLSPPHLVSGIPSWQEWPRGPQGSPQVEAPPPEVEAVAGASPGPAPEPGRDHSAPGAARTRSALLGWAPAAVPREREGAREQVAHSPLGPLPPQLTYPSVPPQTVHSRPPATTAPGRWVRTPAGSPRGPRRGCRPRGYPRPRRCQVG